METKIVKIDLNTSIMEKTFYKKLRTQLFSALCLIFVGSGLLIAGFCVPPMGVIDSSVLVAFGEILTFVGALFGIDYHYRAKEARG